MAEYLISGPALTGSYVLSLDSTSFSFTDEDAFDLVDFLEAKGYIIGSTAQVNKRPHWSLNIPDPR